MTAPNAMRIGLHPAHAAMLRRTRLCRIGLMGPVGLLGAACLLIFITHTTAPASPGHAQGAAGGAYDPWLGISVACLLLEPIILLAFSRRMRLLAKGIEVDGWVVGVNPSRRAGFRQVVCKWEMGKEIYSVPRDVPVGAADRYTLGSPVMLLVDPRAPRFALLIQT